MVKHASYFRRAVLLAIALPACGGAVDPGAAPGDGDGGTSRPGRRSPPDPTSVPEAGGTSPWDAASTTNSGPSEGDAGSVAVADVAAPTADGGSDNVGAPPDDAAACFWTSIPSPAPPCSFSRTVYGPQPSCTGFVGTGSATQCSAFCAQSASCFAGPCPDSAACAIVSCMGLSPPCAPGSTPGNGGRRPGYFASLGFGQAPGGREVGTHFARVACMEAGSVEAFRQLRQELVLHHAPKRLVRAASRAVRDEIRHVRRTSALARRFGEWPISPPIPPPRAKRTLGEVAIENAVEGCVRETYSALECMWQSELATDPVVRATMKGIARDELRHLSLAWEVHSWAMTRLDAGARARVSAAQRAAIVALRDELLVDPHIGLRAEAGLPSAFQSQTLVDAIEAKLAA